MSIAAIDPRVPPTTEPAAPVPLERVEAQLVELASQIAGATCRFLLLVADFDLRGGGQHWGVPSTAHWLSWRCGLSMNAAREQVRVARVLREHPRLIEEFGVGRLSYSKVRAITRAVTPDNVETLIDYARNASGVQLDRIIAGYRRVLRNGNPRAQRAQRAVTWSWDTDGCLVGTFRLPPEQGMKFLTALEAGRSVASRPIHEVEDEEADAVPCEQCSERGRECPHAAQDHRARRGSRSNADTLELMAELMIGTVEATHADDAHVVTPEGANDEGAGTRRRKPSWLPGLDPSERFSIVVHTPAGGSAIDPHLQDSLFADGPGISPETLRRIGCHCSYALQTDDADGNPLHLGRKTRQISGRLAKAVHSRDHGCCQAPGCTNRTSEIHHSWEWGKLGPTCIDYLISVCSHHHWLVHEGGWTVALVRRGVWRWQRPDGTVVPRFTPVVEGIKPLPHEPTITADAIELCTMSRTFDLGTAVGSLLITAQRAQERDAAEPRVDAWAD